MHDMHESPLLMPLGPLARAHAPERTGHSCLLCEVGYANMPLPSLSSLPVTDFSYVAEGGANLVVASTGQHPDLQETVLRHRKRPNSPMPSLLSATTLSEEDASVAFTDKVVIPLLGNNLHDATPRLVSLPVNRAWLQALHVAINPSRPPTRRMVDEIDTDRAYVVLAENMVGSSSSKYDQLSVEIKVRERTTRRHCNYLIPLLYTAEMGISTADSSSTSLISDRQGNTLPILSAPLASDAIIRRAPQLERRRLLSPRSVFGRSGESSGCRRSATGELDKYARERKQPENVQER